VRFLLSQSPFLKLLATLVALGVIAFPPIFFAQEFGMDAPFSAIRATGSQLSVLALGIVAACLAGAALTYLGSVGSASD
jgi:hypothetical protein